MKISKLNIKLNYSVFWERYTLFALCLLAFCVSLGAATVSISKLILLIGFFVQIFLDRKKLFKLEARKIPTIFIWMIVAVTWSLISMTWSDATLLKQWKYFYSHTRFLWLAIIYYLLMSKDRALTTLKWLIYGQILVVTISFVMWLGMDVPLTKAPIEMGVAFTSRLEQPIMTVLVLIILWNFRDYWRILWGDWLLYLIISAMILNCVFVMSGRTGYAVLLVFLAIEIYRLIKGPWRWLAILSPLVLSLVFYGVSPIFSKRVTEILTNSQNYIDGKEATSSEGERLEMWRGSINGILIKPIFGHGVGSMPDVYKEYGERLNKQISQPHQQYLFWWVEFGLVGLLIMLGFFFTLIKDSFKIDQEAQYALRSIIAVLLVVGLFNCPFFGVGMGEFFFLAIAVILRFKRGLTLPLK